MTSRVPRNLLLVSLASLLTDLSTEIGFPLLPLLVTTLGGTALTIGIMEGAAESVASFLKYYSGRLSDRLRRRKELTLLGYSISTMMKLGYGFALLPWHVVGLRTADRFGKGIRAAPRDALIADSTPPHQWGFAYGFHRAADTLGAFLGPLAALGLLALLSVRSVFLIAAIPALLAVLALFLLRERKPHAAASHRPSPVPKNPMQASYLLVVGIFTLGNLSLAFLLLRGIEVGLSPQQGIFVYLAYNASYAILAFPFGWVTDRVGRAPLVALAFALVVAGSFVVAQTDPRRWTEFLPGALLFGVASAAFEGNGRALAADLASPKAKGRALGAYHATIGLASLPAGILAGLLWRFDFRLAYLAGALFALLALGEFLWLWTRGLGARPATPSFQPH